jgi:hypothetical protein
VLKLNGRRISVAGSSLSTSTNTSSSAVSRLPRSIGMWMRRSTSPGRAHGASGLVHGRADLAEPGLHRLQRHRQKAHHVGEHQRRQRAAQQQPGGDAEGGAHPGVDAVVDPGEGIITPTAITVPGTA